MRCVLNDRIKQFERKRKCLTRRDMSSNRGGGRGAEERPFTVKKIHVQVFARVVTVLV